MRWEGERAGKSTERLRRVAREAAAQSRRVWLPDVTDVCRLDDVSGLVGGTPVALADAGGAAPGLDRPVLAIGPEGGWDDAERAAFGPGVGLGPNVLRAETAAVVAGALPLWPPGWCRTAPCVTTLREENWSRDRKSPGNRHRACRSRCVRQMPGDG